MKFITGAIAVFLIVLSANVGAAERHVDPIQNAVDERHQKMVPELMKTCDAKNTGACKDEARMKAEQAVPSRGTKNYCQQAYGKLSPG
nr:hypothetical protein [Escherichia coli]